MSTVPPPSRTPAGPSRAPRGLALTWVVAAVVAAVPAWLLFALSEDAAGRSVGAGMTLLALLGVATGLLVALRGRRALRVSLVMSAVLALGALAGLAYLALDGQLTPGGALFLAGPPVLAGLVTALVARRA